MTKRYLYDESMIDYFSTSFNDKVYVIPAISELEKIKDIIKTNKRVGVVIQTTQKIHHDQIHHIF